MAGSFERFDWFSLAATAVASVGVGGVAVLLGLPLHKAAAEPLGQARGVLAPLQCHRPLVHPGLLRLSLTHGVRQHG